MTALSGGFPGLMKVGKRKVIVPKVKSAKKPLKYKAKRVYA